jgi:hypothetical protein
LLLYLLASGEGRFCGHGYAPRRAIEAADRVVDNIVATDTKKKRPGKEWRVVEAGVADLKVVDEVDEVDAPNVLAITTSRFMQLDRLSGSISPPPSHIRTALTSSTCNHLQEV